MKKWFQRLKTTYDAKTPALCGCGLNNGLKRLKGSGTGNHAVKRKLVEKTSRNLQIPSMQTIKKEFKWFNKTNIKKLSSTDDLIKALRKKYCIKLTVKLTEIHPKLSKKTNFWKKRRRARWGLFCLRLGSNCFWVLRGLKDSQRPQLRPLALVWEILEHFNVGLCTIGGKRYFQVIIQGKITNITQMDCFTGGTREGYLCAIFRSKINFWSNSLNTRNVQILEFFKPLVATLMKNFPNRVILPESF